MFARVGRFVSRNQLVIQIGFRILSRNNALATTTPRRGTCRARFGNETFALCLLARRLACSANRFACLTCPLLRRFLIGLATLHFAKKTFALKFFLQDLKRLIDIVLAYKDFQDSSPLGVAIDLFSKAFWTSKKAMRNMPCSKIRSTNSHPNSSMS